MIVAGANSLKRSSHAARGTIHRRKQNEAISETGSAQERTLLCRPLSISFQFVATGIPYTSRLMPCFKISLALIPSFSSATRGTRIFPIWSHSELVPGRIRMPNAFKKCSERFEYLTRKVKVAKPLRFANPDKLRSNSVLQADCTSTTGPRLKWW